MKVRPLIKKLTIVAITLVVIALSVIVICNVIVINKVSGRTFDDLTDVPYNRYAVLLATSPVTPAGAHNYYFDYRIEAADKLYKAGKADYIIASGGDYINAHKNGCDEPKAILDSLVARGVPADRIILDYDGTRTIHSVVNAMNSGIDSVTFVSQKYHNQRAVYIADKYGIEAVGYNALTPPARRSKFKNTLREFLARVKMFIDINL